VAYFAIKRASDISKIQKAEEGLSKWWLLPLGGASLGLPLRLILNSNFVSVILLVNGSNGSGH
jgi:hypothetical protein